MNLVNQSQYTSWPPKYSAPYQVPPYLLLHKLMKHVLGTEGNLNPIGQTAPSVQAGGWSHKVLVTGTIYGLVQKASQQKMLMDFLANFLSTQKPILDIVKVPNCWLLPSLWLCKLKQLLDLRLEKGLEIEVCTIDICNARPIWKGDITKGVPTPRLLHCPRPAPSRPNPSRPS